MKDDFIPYGRQSIDDADIAAVAAVLRSDWLTQGPAVDDLEAALAERLGARHAVVVSSGTAALHLACLAAGLGEGDEAVTSPITFVASANCIAYAGATPVFADVSPDTVNLDPDELARALTGRTRAVVCVHFAGHPCEMERVSAIARDRGLVVIEDACHALGATYGAHRVGACAHSDMAAFSFHPVKHITTGEGGAVLTNDDGLVEQLRSLRTHGITKDAAKLVLADAALDGAWYYEMQQLGFNYRITDFQCALGSSQLERLDAFLERRRRIASMYSESLRGVPDLLLPVQREGVEHAWHIYPVRVCDPDARGGPEGVRPGDPVRRRAVFDALRRAGIGVQVHHIPVPRHPYYRERFGARPEAFPNAEGYYAGAITLPLFVEMTDADVDRVVRALKEALA